ncbi:alpha/beta-hydrolase [Ascodesmis nigricans]|uniref:Alpha/beta-hydrolase n=1 Tax=Ascodesmis nigricans TaxID=341454 RepID=A0A4S2MZY8_9PEZI|nr:alpha/beta-hydrolase [Ascodesmis nigricans]
MAETVISKEGTHELGDGLKPSTPPKAQILFLHGFSDHTTLYDTLASRLASRGLLFHGFDQRGYGRTSTAPSSLGDSGPTTQILTDVNSILITILNAHPELPTFLVGHSMGGAIALTYAFQGSYRNRLSGIAVWSPAIAIASESQPSIITRSVGRVVAAIAPKKQLVHKLDFRFMSRDREVNKAFEKDPLCHDTGTLQCLMGIDERGRLLSDPEVVKRFAPVLRIWVAHGTRDKCCDYKASREFVRQLEVEDKTFVKYDKWFHKLHAEPGEDKIKFADDLGDWLLARAQAATGPKL